MTQLSATLERRALRALFAVLGHDTLPEIDHVQETAPSRAYGIRMRRDHARSACTFPEPVLTVEACESYQPQHRAIHGRTRRPGKAEQGLIR